MYNVVDFILNLEIMNFTKIQVYGFQEYPIWLKNNNIYFKNKTQYHICLSAYFLLGLLSLIQISVT